MRLLSLILVLGACGTQPGAPDAGQEAGVEAGKEASPKKDAEAGMEADIDAGPPCVLRATNGGGHTCAIRGDGTLWCWGSNDHGQLGLGTFADTYTPTQVTALGGNVVDVSAGAWHTCARKSDKSVWCWGTNGGGEVGDGTATGVMCAGTTCRPSPVMVTSDAIALSATGYGHSCIVKSDNKTWCWGRSVANGSNDMQAAPALVNVADAVDVGTGWFHTCAILKDGNLACWGEDGAGQLGDNDPPGDKPDPVALAPFAKVERVVGGDHHTCALAGSVWCWGANGYGQLGDGTFTEHWIPATAKLGFAPTRVAAGAELSCALDTSGAVWCWGDGGVGSIGNGSTATQKLPAQAQLPLPAVDISAGDLHACAILNDGTLWCWGVNEYGELAYDPMNDPQCNGPLHCSKTPRRVNYICP